MDVAITGTSQHLVYAASASEGRDIADNALVIFGPELLLKKGMSRCLSASVVLCVCSLVRVVRCSRRC